MFSAGIVCSMNIQVVVTYISTGSCCGYHQQQGKLRISNQVAWLFVALALLGFAANSILCRMALAEGSIDVVSFTSIRLASGALLLWLVTHRRRAELVSADRRLPAFMLFLYASLFSYAYLQLSAATGALILFGCVQVGLLAITIKKRQKQNRWEWLALVMANAGFLWLLLPTATSPSLLGAGLMAGAGFAWAAYTWMGRGSKNPIDDTATNFIRTLPYLVVLISVSWYSGLDWNIKWNGLLLAVVSGTLASGVGYICWYCALPALSVNQAGIVQLLVPALAAIGGVFVIGEAISTRLWTAGILIIGGIAISMVGTASKKLEKT